MNFLISQSRIIYKFLHPPERASDLSRSRLAALSGISRDFLARGSAKIQAATAWLLAALLFACVFFPRFSIGTLSGISPVVLRSEDLLLALMTPFLFLVPWPEPGFAARIEKAFLIFLLVCGASILNGFWFRTIDKPAVSFFYLLKGFEYFLLFAAAARVLAAKGRSGILFNSFFLLGLGLAVYGYWEFFSPASKAVYPNYYRLFERPLFHGDANHIGGLLVLWLCFFSGVFLHEKRPLRQVLLLVSILLVYLPFLGTYSRKSYFALGGAFLLAFLFSRERKKVVLLSCLFVLFGLCLPTRLSERLLDLQDTFGSTDPFHSSWANNWAMWKAALWNFDRFFLWGSGLASRHRLFYESQYLQILTETGIVGFISFAALLLAPLRENLISVRKGNSPAGRGIWEGWCLGMFGLFLHGISCMTFTVVKVAMPFWLLTAAVCAALERRDP